MEINITHNYEMFKFRKENREINYNKVLRMKSALLKDGRQIIPIICNGDMEIIDGQHRFQALKELNWDVLYYIDDSISSEDLVSLNNTQNNWSLLDYIHYYANSGNETFVRIEDICKRYSGIPLKAILAAIGKSYIKERRIKSGNVEFVDGEFEEGEAALEFIKKVRDQYQS